MATRRWSLAWLKPPQVPPDGTMSLSDHLRELRYRLLVSLAAVVVATVVAVLFYQQLYDLLLKPFLQGTAMLKASNPGVDVAAYNNGFVAPFMLWLKLCGVAGLVASCPVWLYQLWAFVVPGLLDRERRWALIFLACAVPLFLAGIFVGYWVLPQGISAMLAFTPDSVPVTNLVDLNAFLDLLIMMMLIFGLSFLLPVLLIGLNLVGVVSGRQLGRFRPYAIFLAFVVGAAATPSTDPFSMLALAVPLALLYEISEIVARINDRRRRTPA